MNSRAHKQFTHILIIQRFQKFPDFPAAGSFRQNIPVRLRRNFLRADRNPLHICILYVFCIIQLRRIDLLYFTLSLTHRPADLCHCVLIQRKHSSRPRISAGCSQSQHIISGIQHIAGILLAEVCQISQVKRKQHFCTFSRRQLFRLAECSQLLIFFRSPVLRAAYIDLNHFFPRETVSCIGHFYSYLYLRGAVRLKYVHLLLFHRKVCIGETVAERIPWFRAETVKITISNINAFPVIFFIHISVQVAVFHCAGNIFIFSAPCICRFSRRRCLSADQIRERPAAFHSLLGKEDNTVDAVNTVQKAQIENRACVDYYNRLIIPFGTCFQIGQFRVRQRIFSALQSFVSAFSCLPCNDINTCICIRGLNIRFRNRLSERILIGNTHKIHDFGRFHPHDLPLELFPVRFLTFPVQSGILLDPFLCRHRKSGLLQPFQNGHCMPFIYLARTGSSFDRHPCSGSVQCNFPGRQRKSAVIFQQYDSLQRRPIGNLFVCFLQRRYRVSKRRFISDLDFHGRFLLFSLMLL